MSMEIQLELGHRSAMREKPTAKGFTHDWTAFVRGAEGSNISSIIDKVVFYLHESFPKPRRVVKESPYQLSESGYAGFTMVIEVFFKSKEEPKKVEFYYDLFLKMSTSPANSIRREKLTFQNPSEDFRLKLLTAGGIDCVPEGASGASFLQTQTSAPAQPISEPSRPVAVPTKSALVAEKKIKSRSTVKETSHSSHSKPKKILPPPTKPVSGKEPKSVSKVSRSPENKELKGKSVKPEKESKSVSKRPTSDGQNHHGPLEKKKRNHSSSDSNEKHSDNKIKETKEKKEKHKNKLSGHCIKKEKHKSSHGHAIINKDHIKSPSKSTNHIRSVSPNEDSNDVKPPPMLENDNASSPTFSLMNAAESWFRLGPEKKDLSSGKGSISPMSSEIQCSPPVVMEKLRRNSNHDTEEVFEEKHPKTSIKVEKSPKPKISSKSKKSTSHTNNYNNENSGNSNHRSTKQNGSLKDASNVSPTSNKTAMKYIKSDPDLAYHHELVDLQRIIMALEDRKLLQKVVDIIEETGCYSVTSKSFDFDLYSLDANTVQKLKQYLLV